MSRQCTAVRKLTPAAAEAGDAKDDDDGDDDDEVEARSVRTEYCSLYRNSSQSDGLNLHSRSAVYPLRIRIRLNGLADRPVTENRLG